MFRIQYDPESKDVKKSVPLILSGLAMQTLGSILGGWRAHAGYLSPSPWAWAIIGVGALSLILGVYLLAKAKNRSPAWAWLGLLGFIGCFIVATIEDRSVPDVGVADEPTC